MATEKIQSRVWDPYLRTTGEAPFDAGCRVDGSHAGEARSVWENDFRYFFWGKKMGKKMVKIMENPIF